MLNRSIRRLLKISKTKATGARATRTREFMSESYQYERTTMYYERIKYPKKFLGGNLIGKGGVGGKTT